MHISTKCSIAIHCLVFIHEYGETAKVTSELLAKSTGANPVVIRNILSALKKDGVLAVKQGTGGANLACPPEEVSLYRVCRAIEPDFLRKLMGVHSKPSQICPVGRNIHRVLDSTYQKVQDDLAASMEKVTLANVVSEYKKTQ